MGSFTAPAFPVKPHYSDRSWPAFSLDFSDNLVIEAQYKTPVIYTVTFMVDNQVYETRTYSIEQLYISEPSVPDKPGFTGSWESYDLYELTDITVKAKYIAIVVPGTTFYITFLDENGAQVQKIPFTTSTDPSTIKNPLIAQEFGYNKYWPAYDIFDMDRYLETGSYDLTVKLQRVAIEYKVTFKGHNYEETFTYTVANKDAFKAPAFPVKPHYHDSEWPTFELDFSDGLVVEAKYRNPIEYKVTFKGHEYEKTFTYTVETKDTFTAPAFPAKPHYSDNAWPTFELDFSDDLVVEAKYEAPIEYKVTFKGYNYEKVFTYTVENKDAFKAPGVPAKPHYKGSWPTFELNFSDNLVVEAKYTAIEYKVTFKGYNYEETFTYTAENKDAFTAPAFPVHPYYQEGSWPAFELDYSDNLIVEAQYRKPVEFTATFKVDGITVSVITFTVETESLVEPSIPEKIGYTAKWSDYTLGTENITVEAIYSPISYTVTFKADGVVIDTQTYTVENKNIIEPKVPAKEGFIGVWETYTLDTGDKIVNAVYTKDGVFYITFVDIDGNVIEKLPFKIDTDPSTITAPIKVPEKAGYNVSWPAFDLFDEDRFEETGSYSLTVKAVYTPIQYTATFKVNGKVIANIPFTVETKSITEPSIPEKAGYTAAWSKYTLGTEDITVEAVYTAISYSVTFIADGKEVAVLYYTVEDPSIKEPQVPEKKGYSGKWESYTIDIGDKEVHAVYTKDGKGGADDKEYPIFWWITIGTLSAAGIAIGSIFQATRKKSSRK